MIKIYTDGSCIGNPGKGGWAAIIITDKEKKIISGKQDTATNNQMELLAPIKALKEISIKSKLVKPYVKSFELSFDLEFLVSNPLPTAINLLSFLIIDEAKEYLSTAKYPVLIPSAPS